MPRVLTNYVELKPIGNLGLKIGVSRAAHSLLPNMHTYGSTPPPPSFANAFPGGAKTSNAIISEV